MDVEATVTALESLFEKALQQLATVVAHGRLRVRVYYERVGNLDTSSHLLFDPMGTAGRDRRPSVPYIRTCTPARIGIALSIHKR